MEKIPTVSTRIHPLMAAAAVSVIVLSVAGTAAITGILPNSHSAPEPQLSTAAPLAAAYGAQSAASLVAQPAAVQPAAAYAAPVAVHAPAPALVPANVQYVQPAAQPAPAPKKPAPAPVKKTVQQTKEVHHHHHTTQVARNEAPSYEQKPVQQAPVQQEQKPNYVAIGTGAVIGGLLGNQVGGGNGKKLATVAGVIGGGMLGNEIAKRNQGQ